jgi:hypothetical protein
MEDFYSSNLESITTSMVDGMFDSYFMDEYVAVDEYSSSESLLDTSSLREYIVRLKQHIEEYERLEASESGDSNCFVALEKKPIIQRIKFLIYKSLTSKLK